MALKLIIFDVDGTLVDSAGTICMAARQAFQAHDLVPPPDADIKRSIGLALPELFARLAPQGADVLALAEALKQAFITNRRLGLENSPLYPGAKAALQRLDTDEILLGIATGKVQRGLTYCLDTHRINHHFVTKQTMDEAPGKPNPTMIYNAMNATGVEAKNTIMIGDTSFDMQMAMNAGVRAIGVDWGYHTAEELLQSGAERIVHHFDDLTEELLFQ